MAFDAFLNIPEIPGEATRAGYEGQIQLESFSWGASRSASMETGGRGAATGRVSVTPISFRKQTDQASPLIFMNCCQGIHHPTATITVVKSGGGADVPYVIITLSEVFLTNFSQDAGSGDEVIFEGFEATYGRVEFEYTGQSETGAATGATVGTWDVHAGTS